MDVFSHREAPTYVRPAHPKSRRCGGGKWIELVKQVRSPSTVAEIADASGLDIDTVYVNVRKMRAAGLIEFHSFGDGKPGKKLPAKWVLVGAGTFTEYRTREAGRV